MSKFSRLKIQLKMNSLLFRCIHKQGDQIWEMFKDFGEVEEIGWQNLDRN